MLPKGRRGKTKSQQHYPLGRCNSKSKPYQDHIIAWLEQPAFLNKQANVKGSKSHDDVDEKL